MPFKSMNQEKWMFANHPQMAHKWAAHTQSMGALPQKVGPGSPMNRNPSQLRNPQFGMQNEGAKGQAGSTYTAMLNKGYK